MGAITQSFGSVDDMVTELNEAASGVFGSGWAWLCYTGAGGCRCCVAYKCWWCSSSGVHTTSDDDVLETLQPLHTVYFST
jgi:superoxide dismutase